MIKHIVVWRLKDQAHGNNRERSAELLKQKLGALRGRIPGLRDVEVGIDFSRTPQSADVLLYSVFDSREALDAYQSHPEHEAFKEFVAAIRSERRLIDYET
jgi:heme-degrading monooxygenase HmoA